jgi:hypothetical protein
MIKVLEQGAWINYTNRFNEKELISQAMFLSSRYECSATMVVTTVGFKITQAYFSIHRCPDMSKRTEEKIPELIGGSGHYDGVRAIKDLKDFGDDGKVKELLAECIRGFEQAETYLLTELGFKTREEYEAYWQKDKAEYCRPYWGKMPGLEEWSTYIGAYDHNRTENFYNKYKSYAILQKKEGEAIISGIYNDSFHEMHSELTYNLGSRNISEFDMIVHRAPHDPCYELSHTAADAFIGKPIDSFKKRDIGKVIGGAPGCFHLVDIVADMALAAIELQQAGK